MLLGYLVVGAAAWASGGFGLEAFIIVSGMIFFLKLTQGPPYCRAPPLELIENAKAADAAGAGRLWSIYQSLGGQPAAGPLPLFVYEGDEWGAVLLQDQDNHTLGVAVSWELLELLDNAELRAVLEHELAHARDGNGGRRLMLFIDSLSAALGMFAVVFFLTLPVAVGLSWTAAEAAAVHGGYAAGAFLGACFFGFCWGPRMYARVAQERELRADAGAAAFTSARDIGRALCKIVGPPAARTWRQTLFCQDQITHPSLPQRLAFLDKLK